MAKYTLGQWEIPNYMREGLHGYLDHGIVELGDFLYNVLCNNLVQAFMYADVNNMRNLPAYANFLYNHAPIGSWGSKKKVDAWIENKRKEK